MAHKRKLYDQEEEEETIAMKKKKNENVTENTVSLPNELASSKMNQRICIDNQQVSVGEINDHIKHCLKLNVEDKINEKNVFQLKLIDFLARSLKIHNPSMTNLSYSSVCLDLSGKIYGMRVDKVHTELFRFCGVYFNDNNNENEENYPESSNDINAKNKKRRKARHSILSSVEALKGSLTIINHKDGLHLQEDTVTSNNLFQVKMPQYANDINKLNYYNATILDKVSINHDKKSFSVPLCDDNNNNGICQTYKNFSFFDGLLDEEIQNLTQTENINEASTFRFDLSEDSLLDNDDSYTQATDNDVISPIPINQNNELIDFQSTIVNNLNPDTNYEYSYLQTMHLKRWNGPNHWKLVNKDDIKIKLTKLAKSFNVNKTPRQRKNLLNFNEESLEKSKQKFVQVKIVSISQNNWSKKKNLLPKKTNIYKTENLFSFFTKVCSDDIDDSTNDRENRLADDIIINDESDYEPDDGLDYNVVENNDSIEPEFPLEVNLNHDEALGVDLNDNIDVTPSIPVRTRRTASWKSKVTKTKKRIIFKDSNANAQDVLEDTNVQDNSEIPVIEPVNDQNILEQNEIETLPLTTNDVDLSSLLINESSQSSLSYNNNNLVPRPTIVPITNSIKYCLRPKKIDMRQLQKAVRRSLNVSLDESESNSYKELSTLYVEIPDELSKMNADSLSPALAFLSLLHLAHKKYLIIESSEDNSDVIVKKN